MAKLIMINRCFLASYFLVSALTSQFAVAQDKDAKKDSPKPGPSIVWVNKATDKQLPLPPGTKHLTFHSELVNQDIGYCVYLPAEYRNSPNKRYPVIYNLHGNGGNEFTSVDSIRLLHDQIAAKIVPPMIMVLPNGGRSTFYKDSADGRFPIESIFMKEFIPHVDKTYRTIADRKGRCIEGFSMGGRGATRLAVKYPEMFCSLFCQAGNVPHLLELYKAATPAERAKSLLGPDLENWFLNDVYAVSSKNKARIKKHLRIQIACGTKDGGHIKTIRDFHQHLLELGVDHNYIEIEGLGHRRTEMIERYAPIWFAFHVESMRRAKIAK